MNETQNTGANAMPASKKHKNNTLIPAVVSLLAVAAFLAVWYLAIR